MSGFEVRPVAVVASPLADPAQAPKQGTEGGAEATLAFDPAFADALDGLAPGQRVILLTWLDRADRATLQVHPRDDVRNPVRGVFSTRSADRPNPIGLHPVRVLDVDGTRVRVGPLEAVHGTPVLDVKPVLGPVAGR